MNWERRRDIAYLYKTGLKNIMIFSKISKYRKYQWYYDIIDRPIFDIFDIFQKMKISNKLL